MMKIGSSCPILFMSWVLGVSENHCNIFLSLSSRCILKHKGGDDLGHQTEFVVLPELGFGSLG